MKKTFLLFCLLLSVAFSSLNAANAKHEFRATWLATVWSIDWPKTKATSTANIATQKKELTDIFDKMQAGNMNAVCFQVRGLSDVMYKSNLEPWSSALTGTRGKDPGYDPLAFAIEEAHKRGMELHVWVNPFRVTSTGTLSSSDPVKKNAGEWIIKYDNGSFSGEIIDPGYPEARDYVLEVFMEIVENYDIDGILMDDYFYPYGGTTTEDTKSKALYKPSSGIVDQDKDGSTDDDWRRQNVDQMMKDLYDRLQVTKPWVRFGMGTFGIWTLDKDVANAYGISLPSGITGLDDYEVQACNPVEWVKGGYVDYINPQLYWPTTSTGQSYEKLVKWWGQDVCQHFSELLPGNKKVHFFSSQSCSSNSASSEIIKQIDFNRQYLSSGYTGSVFYNTTAYLKMYSALTSRFTYRALPPAMDWKVSTSLSAPENLTLSGSTLMWSHPSATRFTVYAYPKGTTYETAKENPLYLQKVVYGNSFSVSGINLSTTTIAVVTYDRYGVEHAAALYNAADGDNPGTTPGQPTNQIQWELNGGQVETVTVTPPSLEELTKTFMNDYNSFFNASISTTREILNFLYYGSTAPGGANLVYEMVNTSSSWTWLRDYILACSASNASILSQLQSGTDAYWRYSLASFFTAACANTSYSVDFTLYGQQAQWSTSYQAAHGGVSLPTSVTSTFTLPTPTHPQGYTFLGWYDNADFTGSPLTTIPAYWTGTLYAKWQTTPIQTSVVNWQLNGGYVPATVPSNLELWELFKPYYNTYYNLERADMTIDKVSTFAANYMQDIMTNTASEYKWLGDYITTVATAQSYALTTESAWRWHVHAFFNCSDGALAVKTADFTTAGQPSAWGNAYQKAHTATLPTSVTADYVLPTPLREGYTFLGWYDNADFTGSPRTYIPAYWSGTLYAKWQQNSSSEPAAVIFWYLNGGTVNVTLPSSVTSTYTLPIPTRTGYIFSGWYTSSTFAGDPITTISAGWQGSLYAKWTEETPEEVIYWVLNGGSVSGTLPSFVTSTYTLPTPTREGYTFAGWYSNPSFTGSALTSIPAGWEGTLYAKWNIIENTDDIKWELNGGSYKNGTLPTSVSRRYTLPNAWSMNPPYDGCDFDGWYDNAEFTGNSLTRINAGWEGTLYAKWDCSDVEDEVIFWYLNGGTVTGGNVVVPTQDELWTAFMKAYNSYFNVSISTSTSRTSASGFLYTGKSSYSIQVAKMLTDQASSWHWLGNYIISVSGTPSETDTDVWWRTQLHAFFAQAASYTLASFTAPDYSIYGQPSQWGPAYQAASSAQLPTYVVETYILPTPVREGYTFRGWFDNPSFEGYVLTSIPAGWEGSLYAKWTQNAPEAVISWELNGGYTRTTLPTYVTEAYVLPPLVRDGYTFAGWYDNPEFTGNPITEIPAGWSGTLYAKWESGTTEPETTAIKWQLNGGQENPYNWASKQDMWLTFQDDYRKFYGVEIRNYAMDSCAKWTYDACGDGKAITDMLTYEDKWIWLREYMEKVAYNANFNNGQLGTAVLLRFSLHAFLNNSPANDNTYSGNPDYTLNGQLSYWYLDWGYTWVGHLPTTLTSTYVLPQPYKEGCQFLGWSTDPEGVGYIYELPAGFVGTVYAIWDVMDDVTTSIDGIHMTQPGQMFDILGRPVDQNYKGIVIVNGQKYLLK